MADEMIDEGSPVSTRDEEVDRTKTASEVQRTKWQEEHERRSLTPEEQQAVMQSIFAQTASPLESLLTKLDEWLIQQPEWPLILAAPRATRRAALSQLAKHFATIPKPGGRG